MKKFKLLLLLLLIGFVTIAQEKEEKPFNPWSVDFGIGTSKVNDASYDNGRDLHFNLGARYNFNPTIALGLRLGFDDLKGESVTYGIPTDSYYQPAIDVDATYFRATVEVTVDVLDVVDIHNDYFTLLAHGGPGVALLDTDNDNYGETIGIVSGGFTGIYKFTNNLGVKLDYTIASQINQKRTLDGMFDATSDGQTSNIHNASLGLIFYPGDRDKKPADFYYEPCIPVIQSDTIINNYYTSNITEVTKVVKEEYEPTYQEFVFFDHDKSKIDRVGRNAIYKMYVTLMIVQDSKVKIIGWASDTDSSAAYNLALSERRCEDVKAQLIDAGIDESRITIDAEGKDYHLDNENVHGLARRVELLIE